MLDLEFLRRAEKVIAFNIYTKDFSTLKYKKEIQYLINKHFFPKFDLSQTIDYVDKNRLNNLINKLKTEDLMAFERLHNYNLKGIGPGEVTLFFLINNAVLTTDLSSGIDLIVGSKKYEVKAVQIYKESIAYDFRIGVNIFVSDIIDEISKLVNFEKMNSKNEIRKTTIDALRETSADFREIEEKFADRAYKYFKDHELILVNNSKSSRQGNIEAVKRIKKEEIMIERVTGGSIKPMIKL